MVRLVGVKSSQIRSPSNYMKLEWGDTIETNSLRSSQESFLATEAFTYTQA